MRAIEPVLRRLYVVGPHNRRSATAANVRSPPFWRLLLNLWLHSLEDLVQTYPSFQTSLDKGIKIYRRCSFCSSLTSLVRSVAVFLWPLPLLLVSLFTLIGWSNPDVAIVSEYQRLSSNSFSIDYRYCLRSVSSFQHYDHLYERSFIDLSTVSTSSKVKMLAARAARPKLALALPSSSSGSLALKTPHPRTPISPSPISPTVRNTRLNQRGFSTLQQPTFAYAQPTNTKSILKKSQTATSTTGKKLKFNEEPAIRCITPVPEDYHGTYVKMTRDERRWGNGSREWGRNVPFSFLVTAEWPEHKRALQKPRPWLMSEYGKISLDLLTAASTTQTKLWLQTGWWGGFSTDKKRLRR